MPPSTSPPPAASPRARCPSCGDYVEQVTFLLFLKMAEEQAQLRAQPSTVPAGSD